MAAEFFGRRRECRFYTAGCGNKMAVSVTGPRAVNELGGPVIPGNKFTFSFRISHSWRFGAGDRTTYLLTGIRTAVVPYESTPNLPQHTYALFISFIYLQYYKKTYAQIQHS